MLAVVLPCPAASPGSRPARTTSRVSSAASALVFLAVAAVAAAAGWVLGDALPLIVALVIAGIDVVETSFLLLVVGHGTADPRS